jgi:hypothetical protein
MRLRVYVLRVYDPSPERDLLAATQQCAVFSQARGRIRGPFCFYAFWECDRGN